MDEREIQNWRSFCESKSPYTPDHFSSLFMELYSEPLTAKDKDNLRTIFSLVPHSTRALKKMLLLDDPAKSRSDEEIVVLVRQDLHEMRQILRLVELLAAIDSGEIEVTLDEDRFQRACSCDLNRKFFYELASYLAKDPRQLDNRIRALSNAFYGLASNLRLQFALTADLLQLDVNFDNYFDLYRIGVDYALCDDGVVAMNYRAKFGVSI